MKIKGSELQFFMDDGWPGDDWYLECNFDFPDPDEEYDTADMEICYQGRNHDPSFDYDLGKLIRKWRKTRTSAFLTVIVPKASEDALRSAIASVAGAKIQGGAKP